MITTLIPRYTDAVHINEVKLDMKRDDLTDDDTLTASRVTTAQNTVETWTGANRPRHRVMVSTTFQLVLDRFPTRDGYPRNRFISLTRIPLTSVISVTYVDTNGVTQTMDQSLYVVDYVGGRIILAYQQAWPVTRDDFQTVVITFVAGHAAMFTVTTSDTPIAVFGRVFAVGTRVRICNSGGELPSPLRPNTDYFIVSAGLSASLGGSAMSFSTVGTGYNFATDIGFEHFENLRSAMCQLVGFWNYNREGIIAGTRAASVELPMSIKMKIALSAA